MKFYYNGQLVRTSKTHEYTHAVVTKSGDCIGCRTNRQNAEYIISTEIHQNEMGIKNAKAAIEAIKAGKSIYRCHIGNRSYYEKCGKSIEYYEKWIKNNEERIEYIRNNWIVVELEQR